MTDTKPSVHRGYTEHLDPEKIEGMSINQFMILCDTHTEDISIISTRDRNITCDRCLKVMGERGGEK